MMFLKEIITASLFVIITILYLLYSVIPRVMKELEDSNEPAIFLEMILSLKEILK